MEANAMPLSEPSGAVPLQLEEVAVTIVGDDGSQ
jgi:hypothetical protein